MVWELNTIQGREPLMSLLGSMTFVLALASTGVAHAATAPLITTQPTNQTVGGGVSVQFRVLATGDPAPEYQWYFNQTMLAGRTNAFLTLFQTQTTNQGDYFATASNTVGVVTSETARLTVITNAPVIVAQPTNMTVRVGQIAQFSVMATGLPPPRYQWRFEGEDMPGRVSSALVFSANETHAGGYSVVASNSAGMATSRVAILTVSRDALITLHPTNVSLIEGQDARLQSGGSGQQPLSRQWYHNGSVLPDATNDLLRLRSIRLSSAGEYYFVISNYLGTATSEVATVSIRPASRQAGAVDIDYYTGTNDLFGVTAMQFDSRQRVITAAAVSTGSALIRIGADGRVDTLFTSNGISTSTINGLVVANDDTVVLAGLSSVNGIPRRNLARFHADGRLDTNFVPVQAFSEIYCAAVDSGGRILAGGKISTTLAAVYAFTAEGALDGSLNLRLEPPPNGGVEGGMSYPRALLSDDEAFILRMDGAIMRRHSDGSLDTSFSWRSLPLMVFAKMIEGGGLLIGGGADLYDSAGLPRRYLARLDAHGKFDPTFELDAALTNRITQVTNAAVQVDGRVVIAAVLRNSTSNLVVRLEANGRIDPTFTETIVGGAVREMLVQDDGRVIVGGTMTDVNGYRRNGLFRLYGDTLAAPTIVRQPQDLAMTEEQQGTLFVEVSVGADLHYQWFHGTEPVAGGTNRLLRFARVALEQSGDYLVVVSNAMGAATSSVARVTVSPSPLLAGNVDLTWNVDCDGAINAVVRMPDGRFLIGGRFTRVANRTRNSVARLHADGSLDESFDPGTNAASLSIERLALTADGKVLAGGMGGLVRLNADGSRDSAFQSAWSQPVRAVAALPDGKVIVGGDSAPIWRLNNDGSRDTGFSTPLYYTGPNYDIVVQANGRILVSTPTYSVLRLQANGAVDTSFSTEHFMNYSPYSIHVRPEGDLLVGGRGPFSGFGFVVHLGADGRKACLTGPCLFDIRSGAVNWVSSDACNRVLAGGRFTSIPSNSPPHLARLLFNGLADPEFTVPFLNGAVLAGMPLPDGRILIAGEFTRVGGVARNRIAILHGGPFSPPAITSQPVSQTTGEGHQVTLSTSVPCVEPGASLQWHLNGVALAGESNATIQIANVLRGHAGGYTLVASNALGVATSATAQVTVNHAPHVQGAPFVEKPSLGLPSNSVVHALLALPDGKLLVGGSFSNFAGRAHVGLLRLNADGRLDEGFAHTWTNIIRTLALQDDGKIIAVEQTPYYTPGYGSFVRRLWPNGTRDTNFGSSPTAYSWGSDYRMSIPVAVNRAGEVYVSRSQQIWRPRDNWTKVVLGDVFAMAFQPDGKLVLGGTFPAIGGSGTNGLPCTNLVRLLTNGFTDLTFLPDAGAIFALAIQPDGKVVIGGQFTRAGPRISRGVARYHADGSVDLTFTPNPGLSGLGAAVHALALQPDGKVVIGGTFTHYDGGPRNGLARLNADGSLDETFQPGSGISGGISRVSALAMSLDGTLYLGGSFTHLNNVPRQNWAAAYNNPRLYNLVRNGSEVSVSFLSLLERTYILEFKQHWDDALWTTLTTLDGDGTVKGLSVSDTSAGSGFYRIRVE
jgi:uncharacterized delta-60 repeat protein